MLRLLRAAFPAAVVLVCACLFSTTPPKPSADGDQEPAPDPNSAVVVGQVMHFGLVDRVYRRAPGRYVSIVAFGPDRNGDGQLDRLGDQDVRSDRSGTYRATIQHRDLQAVELKAWICSYDPATTDLECCIENPPCPPSQCNIWTTPRRFALHPGNTLNQQVIVPCMQ
jgi:hypothetical protein